MHTKDEYLNALKIVREYELQNKNIELSIFEECTINNIVSNICKHYNKSATAYWVSLDGNIPERNPDAMIVDSGIGFYTIEGGRKTYDTIQNAYKGVVSKLKRMHLIN